jgi:aspartate dehydrogenase
MIRVGIVGAGAIGTQLARGIRRRFSRTLRLTGVLDRNPRRERRVRAVFRLPRRKSVEALVRAADLVIEAASAEAAFPVARAALRAGRDALVLSTGGLIGRERELARLLARAKGHVYLPSGALAGLDAVKAAAFGRIRRAVLTTRKPPAGLEGAPLVRRKSWRLGALKGEKLLFRGSARRAVREFPQNINVSATLALAGVGADRTEVRVYAVPGLRRNVHEIRLEGDFGTFTARAENVPDPSNPRTSRLAVLSALATLQGIVGRLQAGT